MITIEKVDRLIGEKVRDLPPGVKIITPAEEINSRDRARMLITGLNRIYIEHGITKNESSLVVDIDRGVCRTWFAARDGDVVGTTARIDSAKSLDSEIGRATSTLNGVGGLLMLLAAKDILESGRNIVAEVRISDEFRGVPSGIPTQKVCFGHLELTSINAVMPAFNHAGRNELFAFTNNREMLSDIETFLPSDQRAKKIINDTAIALAKQNFAKQIKTRERPNAAGSSKFHNVASEPFCVVLPHEISTLSLETTIKIAEQRNPFCLVPIEASPSMASTMVECLNLGFIPCGIDKEVGPNGNPVILFGKLRRGTVLAPIKLFDKLIPRKTREIIHKIDTLFRKQI